MANETKKILWAAADKLRSKMDAAEYKHTVLGLIFLNDISDSFAERRGELGRRFADPDGEYFTGDESLRESDLEDRDFYTAANVFWVTQEARWVKVREQTK